MDTIIFLLILAALLTMRRPQRWLVLGLFFAALAATVKLAIFAARRLEFSEMFAPTGSEAKTRSYVSLA